MYLICMVFTGILTGTVADDDNAPHIHTIKLDLEPISNFGLLPHFPRSSPNEDEDRQIARKYRKPLQKEKRPWYLPPFDFLNRKTTTDNPRHTTAEPNHREIELMDALKEVKQSLDSLSSIITKLSENESSFTLRSWRSIDRRERNVNQSENNKNNVEESAINTSDAVDVRASNEPEAQRTNIRRSGHKQESEVRDKLLTYLDDGFDELQIKLDSLTKFKRVFDKLLPYKIGYIAANVDTLAVSIKNLREEARRNGMLWGERQILNVYDHLMMSNSLITNLLDTVRLLME